MFVPVLVLALLGTRAPGPARMRELTEAEGRELAIMALAPDARKLPKLSADLYGGLGAPGFYWFEVTAEVSNASPILGHFAVNRATGDVWDPVWCKKLSSPELERLQKTLRQKIRLGDGELRRLSGKVPCEP